MESETGLEGENFELNDAYNKSSFLVSSTLVTLEEAYNMFKKELLSRNVPEASLNTLMGVGAKKKVNDEEVEFYISQFYDVLQSELEEAVVSFTDDFSPSRDIFISEGAMVVLGEDRKIKTVKPEPGELKATYTVIVLEEETQEESINAVQKAKISVLTPNGENIILEGEKASFAFLFRNIVKKLSSNNEIWLFDSGDIAMRLILEDDRKMKIEVYLDTTYTPHEPGKITVKDVKGNIEEIKEIPLIGYTKYADFTITPSKWVLEKLGLEKTSLNMLIYLERKIDEGEEDSSVLYREFDFMRTLNFEIDEIEFVSKPEIPEDVGKQTRDYGEIRYKIVVRGKVNGSNFEAESELVFQDQPGHLEYQRDAMQAVERIRKRILTSVEDEQVKRDAIEILDSAERDAEKLRKLLRYAINDEKARKLIYIINEEIPASLGTIYSGGLALGTDGNVYIVSGYSELIATLAKQDAVPVVRISERTSRVELSAKYVEENIVGTVSRSTAISMIKSEDLFKYREALRKIETMDWMLQEARERFGSAVLACAADKDDKSVMEYLKGAQVEIGPGVSVPLLKLGLPYLVTLTKGDLTKDPEKKYNIYYFRLKDILRTYNKVYPPTVIEVDQILGERTEVTKDQVITRYVDRLLRGELMDREKVLAEQGLKTLMRYILISYFENMGKRGFDRIYEQYISNSVKRLPEIKVLLVGPVASGKTTLAYSFAKLDKLKFEKPVEAVLEGTYREELM